MKTFLHISLLKFKALTHFKSMNIFSNNYLLLMLFAFPDQAAALPIGYSAMEKMTVETIQMKRIVGE